MIDLLKIVRMHARKVYRVHRQTQALRQRRVSRSSKATVLCADAPEHSPVETQKFVSGQPQHVWQWPLSKEVVATVCPPGPLHFDAILWLLRSLRCINLLIFQLCKFSTCDIIVTKFGGHVSICSTVMVISCPIFVKPAVLCMSWGKLMPNLNCQDLPFRRYIDWTAHNVSWPRPLTF